MIPPRNWFGFFGARLKGRPAKLMHMMGILAADLVGDIFPYHTIVIHAMAPLRKKLGTTMGNLEDYQNVLTHPSSVDSRVGLNESHHSG